MLDALLIPFDITESDPLLNPFKLVNEIDLDVENINFLIVDGHHTFQAVKEVITNPIYSVSMEAKKEYERHKARFLDPLVEPSEVIQICCQLNSSNKVFYKTPFIDCVCFIRHFLFSNDKLKKTKIGYSNTTKDKVWNFIYFLHISTYYHISLYFR